jgi:hypothetical protein
MKRMIVAVVALAAMMLPRLAAAQTEHSERSRKAEIHLSREVVVGDKTLTPGDYTFQCRNIDGTHYLVVETTAGDPVARVPCEAQTLTSTIDISGFRSVQRNGKEYVTAVTIKGETIAHRIAPAA